MSNNPLAVQIQALVAEQKDVKQKAKQIRKDLRSVLRRNTRLRKRATLLSTSDLQLLLRERLVGPAASLASDPADVAMPAAGLGSDPPDAAQPAASL